jgi:protein-L-isoaspartate O-methyltransferase
MQTTHPSSERAVLKCADAWERLPQHAHFDAIHVGAGAESLPDALVKQLKVIGWIYGWIDWRSRWLSVRVAGWLAECILE